MIKAIDFPKIIFRGIGQIMFQNNSITGLLFLIGIFYNSWVMGIGAIVGVLIGTITAILFRYNKENILNGLYGFNGALVGLALTFFFKLNWSLIALIILGSYLPPILKSGDPAGRTGRC